jgi:hypothetical protein
MLAWTDAPGHGLGGSTPAWNNDLDLRVTADGQTFFGNVLDNAGWSTTGGAADAKNNTEAVFLQPAQHAGSVTVEVLATDINSDALPHDGDATDQDFALVCYNCADAVQSQADIGIVARTRSRGALPLHPVRYSVDVTNAGPADEAVSVTSTMPQLTDVSASGPAGWSCGSVVGVMTCSQATALVAGTTDQLTFEGTVAGDATGPIEVTFFATGLSPDPNMANNSSVVSLPLLDTIFADDFEPVAP